MEVAGSHLTYFEYQMNINGQGTSTTIEEQDMTTTKNSKGTVVVEPFRNRLRLRLPRQLYDGKQKWFTLGLNDTPENRKIAQGKAKEIESDILFDRFDSSLDKYRPSYLKPVTNNCTLTVLWQRFVNYRKPYWKETTYAYIKAGITPLIAKLEGLSVDDFLIAKERLQQGTTIFQAKRAIVYLNAACRWGLKNGLVLKNPFEGVAAEMPKYNYQDNPTPSAFTKDEAETIVKAFKAHKGNFNGRGLTGCAYAHYAPLVEFWFKTGCRPSEGIGLRWKDVSPDCSTIAFAGSIVTCGDGRTISVKKSKNNRTRKFPCSESLRTLLLSICPDDCQPDALVFPSPQGKAINYHNFSHNAWKKIVDPIKPDTTPYSCRDTFITAQIMAGAPETAIAKWTDTSVEMIEKHYADVLKLDAIRPFD
ncbi:MAG: tyrosine-type recombinase/integrase [Microcystaceae cyanobacterium]